MGEQRTYNTLFMLSSVDGKISTGENDERDFDKDLKTISGLKEGLPQYYSLEQKTDLHSFNTGRVMAKVGWNNPKRKNMKLPVSFIILDNTHLDVVGVKNLSESLERLYIITKNPHHPAFRVKQNNLEVLYYKNQVNFKDLFQRLKSKYKIQKVTIQSGATVNSILIREKLIDRISLVMCPALVGGERTPSLIGGKTLETEKELKKIGVLKLRKVNSLKNSYLHVIYDVVS